jgi:hypothetical protein
MRTYYGTICLFLLFPLAVLASYSITKPDANTVWKTGSQVVISWTYPEDDTKRAGAKIKLELYRVQKGFLASDRLINTITGEVEASAKSVVWTAPQADASAKYYVQLSRLDVILPDRAKSAEFTIVKADNVTEPTTDEPGSTDNTTDSGNSTNGTLSAECEGVRKECERQEREFVDCQCGAPLTLAGAIPTTTLSREMVYMIGVWSVLAVLIGSFVLADSTA